MVRQASVKVLDIIEPVVTGLGYEFVGAEYLPQGKHSLLRVYIDKPENGVSVDDCALVSRQISGVLDVEDPISGQYSLEISSPGLDRLLFTPQQFEPFVGYEVKLRLSKPLLERRKLTAVILGVEGDSIKLEFETEEVQLAFADIEQARLVPKFD